MKGHGAKYERKKEEAIASLLTQKNIEEATPPSTKARAADSVLDHSAKAIELEDIEARVAELERAADPAKRGTVRWPEAFVHVPALRIGDKSAQPRRIRRREPPLSG